MVTINRRGQTVYGNIHLKFDKSYIPISEAKDAIAKCVSKNIQMEGFRGEVDDNSIVIISFQEISQECYDSVNAAMNR